MHPTRTTLREWNDIERCSIGSGHAHLDRATVPFDDLCRHIQRTCVVGGVAENSHVHDRLDGLRATAVTLRQDHTKNHRCTEQDGNRDGNDLIVQTISRLVLRRRSCVALNFSTAPGCKFCQVARRLGGNSRCACLDAESCQRHGGRGGRARQCFRARHACASGNCGYHRRPF